MKIVIVGAGKIGYSLAEELANENHDITVVDIEKEKVKLLSDTLDVMTLCGNGAAISVQREANVDESDLLIAVTAQDELNLLCCLIAKKIGAKHTIARSAAKTPSRACVILSIPSSFTFSSRSLACP